MSKSESNVKIMDIPFTNSTMDEFVDENIKNALVKQQKCFIVTANPEILMATYRDKAYQKIVQEASYVVPDGIGVILASKYKRQPLKERIAGFDLMKNMLRLANETKASCFFLGASDEVNQEAVAQISVAYPEIKVAGHHHGYFDLADTSVAEQVIAAQPDFVFAALGFPKQEKWIAAHLDEFSKGIFMGVGGSLDVFAGNVKRAPNFWIKWNIEWLYRLLKQPFRWKRMLPIMTFMWLVIRGKA